MTEGPAIDRRASSTPPRALPSGRLRRVLAAVRAALLRPLADDEARVAHWVRHVRIGVLLSELCALAVIGYTLLTHSPGRHSPVTLALAGVVVLGCPMLFLLPLPAMMRDFRGPTMFYAWTIATTVQVIVGTRLDGGSSSPLDALLFVSLTYMAITFSPYGVIAMGSVMTGSYLVFVELPGLTTSGLFFIAVLVAFTLICTLASANSWAAHDRQQQLILTREMLAATDPLTGIPNRRAFLERVSRAVTAAAWGHQAVVCLIDLDGFTAVNDDAGHAAGDDLLRGIGSALGAAVRETDTVARLGGDEFAVLAEVSVAFSGEMLAERLRLAVAAISDGRVTGSVGLAEVESGDDVEDLMHRAEAAVHRSKTAGGDRVTSLAF